MFEQPTITSQIMIVFFYQVLGFSFVLFLVCLACSPFCVYAKKVVFRTLRFVLTTLRCCVCATFFLVPMLDKMREALYKALYKAS